MRFVFNHRQLCKWNFIIELTVVSDHDNINERTCFQAKIRKIFVYQKNFVFNLKKKIQMKKIKWCFKYFFLRFIKVLTRVAIKRSCASFMHVPHYDIVARFTIHMQNFYIHKHRSTITSQSAPYCKQKIFLIIIFLLWTNVFLFFSLLCMLIIVCFKFSLDFHCFINYCSHFVSWKIGTFYEIFFFNKWCCRYKKISEISWN